MKKVTIKDIAKEAGVSVGTVQRALNNFGRLSPETREKVKKCAKKMGYEPSYIAQTFATGKTYNIGVICPQFNGGVFDLIINETEARAYEKGYVICLGESKMDQVQEKNYLSLMQRRKADGIIITPFTERGEENSYSYLAEINRTTPLVVIEQNIDFPGLNVIATDNYFNVYETVKYLFSHNRKRIGFLHWGSVPWDFAQRDRLKGYKDAVRDLNLPDLSFTPGERSCPIDREKIKDYIETKKPEIIIGLFDFYTIEIMKHLYSLGLRVPQDIEVIGYDNLPITEIMFPSLSSIAQPAKEIGRRSFEILMNNIEKKGQPPVRELIKGSLVLRNSTHKDLMPTGKTDIPIITDY
ncbi:MAG: LacI family DNA-binding transcriptional regulator [Armatimonadetes bacterium]|nr:LacI family DNA-binding transcriptional regulator [Candidatus Hippobium faecium]